MATNAKTILKAALTVGTLDICAAFIQVYLKTGKESVSLVLLYIGRAVLGKTNTLSDGALMAIGLLMHYIIAASFTVAFFLTVAKTRFAKQQRLLTGILYGLFIWTVMNLAVLPVTGTRKFPDFSKELSNQAIAAGILIICIGVPLAFIANPKPMPAT